VRVRTCWLFEETPSNLGRMSEWAKFLRAGMIRRGFEQVDLSRATGISHSSVSRWLTSEVKSASPASVRKVAAALDVPFSEAQRAAGHLSESESGVRRVMPDVTLLSRRELLAELDRRMTAGETALDAGAETAPAEGLDRSELAGLGPSDVADVHKFAAELRAHADNRAYDRGIG
jgi:transcriptional regulator with XRE-family HTH domain